MKNYDEMTRKIAERVFRRGDELLELKRKRAARIKHISFSVSGICAVLMIGFGIWHNAGIRSAVDDLSSEKSGIVSVEDIPSTTANNIEVTSASADAVTSVSTAPPTTSAAPETVSTSSSASTDSIVTSYTAMTAVTSVRTTTAVSSTVSVNTSTSSAGSTVTSSHTTTGGSTSVQTTMLTTSEAPEATSTTDFPPPGATPPPVDVSQTTTTSAPDNYTPTSTTTKPVDDAHPATTTKPIHDDTPVPPEHIFIRYKAPGPDIDLPGRPIISEDYHYSGTTVPPEDLFLLIDYIVLTDQSSPDNVISGAEVYMINYVNFYFAVAVRFEGSSDYYVYQNEDFSP